MPLSVQEGFDYDTYKDTVRVHSSHRNGIASGKIVCFSVVGGESTVVAVRGLSDKEAAYVRLDLETRRRLKVEVGEMHEFALRKANPLEKLQWAARASDPTARIAAWIAIWSFVGGAVFGLAGVILGVLALKH